MNQSIHQLLRLILQGFAWFLQTIEVLWDWSWSQIVSAFNLSWANLPAWKMAVTAFGVLVFVVVAGLFSRGVQWVVASVPDHFWEKFL
jgi:hypothetical protein